MVTTAPVAHVKSLDLSQIPRGTVARLWLHLINDGIGAPVRIPLIVARGAHDGPVLGITAAIHGNELNGIPVIQHLFHNDLRVDKMRGTVVGALVINVPGLLRRQRDFNDGVDLNRIAPGKANGTESAVYVHRVVDRIIRHFDYHLDLHTASTGRVNSFYVRADMSSDEAAKLAKLQNAQIIVDNKAGDGTLRGAASDLGIKSITIELRDPHIMQHGVVEDSLIGIRNVLHYLRLQVGPLLCPMKQTVLCQGSYWMYTDEGGILSVLPRVAERVAKGQLIAEVRDIFGDVTREYHAPEDGIVVGRSVDPINQTGSRILHLGTNPVEIPCLIDESA